MTAIRLSHKAVENQGNEADGSMRLDPNLLRLILSAGQVANVTQGAALIAGIPTTAVSAEKGYDSDELVKTTETADAIGNIPHRSN